MKITKIDTITAGKYLFVKVHTDAGITGIGEAGCWGFLEATKSAVATMEKMITGFDPMKTEYIWQYIYRSMYFRGSVIMSALAAIDIALWDIKGKALGVPVYQLLGGKCRDKVRTYPAVFKFTRQEMADRCLRYKKQGFTAARLMITADMSQKESRMEDMIFNSKVQVQAEKVKACRRAVGDDFDLILEVHRSMNFAQASAFAKSVEKYNPLFLEDPIPPDNNNAMAALAQSISIPIATGERFININEFEDLLAKNGARYIRPDVCALGGITPSKKAAAIAEAHYVDIVPHNPLGPVSTAACLQLDAAVPNVCIQEFPSFYTRSGEENMLKKPLEIKDGCLIIPDAPGIGIELIDDIDTVFPPALRTARCRNAFDGFIMDV